MRVKSVDNKLRKLLEEWYSFDGKRITEGRVVLLEKICNDTIALLKSTDDSRQIADINKFYSERNKLIFSLKEFIKNYPDYHKEAIYFCLNYGRNNHSNISS